MQLSVLQQSFDREKFRPVGLNRKYRARFDRLSVKDHGACAAIAGITADVCSRKAQLLADEVNQKKPRLDLHLALHAVNFDANPLLFRHKCLPMDTGSYLPTRSRVNRKARFASSLTSPFLYTTGPRKSALGSASSAAS